MPHRTLIERWVGKTSEHIFSAYWTFTHLWQLVRRCACLLEWHTSSIGPAKPVLFHNTFLGVEQISSLYGSNSTITCPGYLLLFLAVCVFRLANTYACICVCVFVYIKENTPCWCSLIKGYYLTIINFFNYMCLTDVRVISGFNCSMYYSFRIPSLVPTRIYYADQLVLTQACAT